MKGKCLLVLLSILLMCLVCTALFACNSTGQTPGVDDENSTDLSLYNVNFITGTAEVLTGCNLSVGDKYTLPELQRTDCTFEGWYYEGKKIDQSGIWQINQKVTLTAKWTVQNATQGLIYEPNADNSAYIVTGYTGSSIDVLIADNYNAKPIVGIGVEAFYDNENITSVAIPNTATYIGDRAFDGCKNLKSIVFGDNVQSVGSSAFRDCQSIVNIVVGNKVDNIGEFAFMNCTNLYSVMVCDNVTSIGYGAFYGCQKINDITLPFVGGQKDSLVDNYFSYIFGGRSYVDNQRYTPQSITTVNVTNTDTIPANAFANCISIDNFTICDNVTSIGVNAFNNTGYYNQSTNWQDGVLYIDKFLIQAKDTLKGSYSVKNDTLCVADNAFYDCNISSVTIPDSVVSIGASAFEKCDNLTNVAIGRGVVKVGFGAFADCDNIASMTLPFVGANKYETKNSHFGYIFGAESYQQNRYEVPESLHTVNITNTTAIPEYAFYFCQNLLQVTLPDTAKTINKYAFYFCNNLKNVDMFDGLESISEYAFNCCVELNYINIPSTVTTIGEGAFGACYGISTVTISGDLRSIGYNAFSSCYRLLEVVNLSNMPIKIGETSYGKVAYYAKQILTNSQQSRLIQQGEYRFYKDIDNSYYLLGYCGTDTDLVLPDNVEGNAYDFYYGVFKEEHSLRSIVIPDCVRTISEYAFQLCDNLHTVQLGNGVERFEQYAFDNCTQLTNITIPQNTNYIDYDAFDGCQKLIEVVNLSQLELEYGGYGNLTRYAKNIITNEQDSKIVKQDDYLFYIDDNVNYLLAYVGNDRDLVLPNDINGQSYDIYEGAFLQLNIKSVVIANNVNKIMDRAFDSCTKLEYIVIPDSVTSLGEYAFYFCTALHTVELGSGLTEIAPSTFGVCSNLSNLIFSGNIKEIGSSAFVGCSNFVNIVLPQGLETIGARAFDDCKALQTIYIPSSVTSIGECIFLDCENLVSIVIDKDNQKYYVINNSIIDKQTKTLILGNKYGYIPDDGSVTAIGDYAFAYYDELTNITIPDTIISIGSNAFNNCINLESIALSNNLQNIGSYAFYKCQKLAEIVLPDSVKSISSYAFHYCTSLVSVKLPSDLTTVGEGMFYKCTSLQSVVLPTSLREISKGAFSYCQSLKEVYYLGNTIQWGDIRIYTQYNEPLISATVFYYSENTPTDTGNYWHYVDGVVTKW